MPERAPGPVPLRHRAEALLARDQAAAATPSPPVESSRLVHELQVHQIELELQNEELARGHSEAAALRDKYRDLYDFAPIGYFSLDGDGRITGLNLRGASMLGNPRAGLVGRQLKDFLHPESMPHFEEFFKAAALGSEEESMTLLLDTRVGDPVYAKVQARFCPEAEPATMKLVMMDVTAVKFANDELQRAFEKFFTYWRP